MNLDAVTVRPDVTIEVVLRYCRMRGELPERTDRLFVVNRHDQYLGGVDLTRLITRYPLADANRALADMAAGRVMKPVLDPGLNAVSA